MKNRFYIIFTFIISLLSTTSIQAQQALRVGIFKIDDNSYEITKLTTDPIYVIWNMDRSELRPNLEEVNGISLELARTKMTNEEELKKTVCKALGKEKREQMVAAKEKISGWIYYRTDGTVISIVFSVSENTTLTLNDLARIENTLKQRFKATLESRGNLHQHLYHVNFNYEWDFGK